MTGTRKELGLFSFFLLGVLFTTLHGRVGSHGDVGSPLQRTQPDPTASQSSTW